MKTVAPILFLLALAPFAQAAENPLPELPCTQATDPGTAVQVSGQDPFGADARITAYPDGIAVRTPAKIFFMWNAGGKWLLWEGDPQKPNFNPTVKYAPKKIGNVSVVTKGDTLTFKSESDTAPTVTFTLVDLTKQSEAVKKGQTTFTESHLTASGPHGGDLGTLHLRALQKEGTAAIDAYNVKVKALPKDERKRAEEAFTHEFWGRSLRAAPTTADLSGGEKMRTGCKGAVADVFRGGIGGAGNGGGGIGGGGIGGGGIGGGGIGGVTQPR